LENIPPGKLLPRNTPPGNKVPEISLNGINPPDIWVYFEVFPLGYIFGGIFLGVYLLTPKFHTHV